MNLFNQCIEDGSVKADNGRLTMSLSKVNYLPIPYMPAKCQDWPSMSITCNIGLTMAGRYLRETQIIKTW